MYDRFSIHLCLLHTKGWRLLLHFYLSLLDDVVWVTARETGTLQQIHYIIFSETKKTFDYNSDHLLISRNFSDVFKLEKNGTYVTIFLSKKYWSFFAPITRRRDTSSLSIWEQTISYFLPSFTADWYSYNDKLLLIEIFLPAVCCRSCRI